MLPLGAGRFMHLVVLYGYQGADADAEQLALTEQLIDAALGELSVVARGQPCMLVGDFNVEPQNPLPGKRVSAGLWVDLEVSWALATGKLPASTCILKVVIVGTLLLVVLLLLLLLFCLARFRLTGGLPLILLLGLFLTVTAGLVESLSRFGFLLYGLLLGCLLLIRVGGVSLLMSRGFGEYMMCC